MNSLSLPPFLRDFVVLEGLVNAVALALFNRDPAVELCDIGKEIERPLSSHQVTRVVGG